MAGILSSLLLLLSAWQGLAQTIHVWTNNVAGIATGGWDTPLNWSPNGLPGAGDTADFSTLAITNASTISLNADQTIGNLIFGDVFPQGTWVLDSSGNLTVQTSSGSPTISVTNQLATIQSTILGTQGFTKLGAGTLVLSSGSSTYSGFTTNSAGSLTIGAASSGTADVPISGPFGVSTLVLMGGSLNTSVAGDPIYNGIIVPTGATVSMGTFITAAQLDLRGSITGGGTINESGSITAGTHLSGTNSGFTGTFNSTGGGSHRVRFDNPNSGSASAAWNASATTTDGWGFTGMGASGSIIYFGSLTGNGQMRSDNGNNTSFTMSIGALNANANFTGTILANGTQLINVTKEGSGTQIFSGNNTYNGPTTINSGALQLGAGGTTGALGSARLTNNAQLVFSYNRADTFACSPNFITGTGSMSYTNLGTGIMTMNATNNESGDTAIAAGTIRLLNPLSLPGGLGVGNLILNGTLDVNSNSIALNGLSGSGTLDNVTNAAAVTLTIGSNDVNSAFSGVIKNTGAALSLVKAGAGKVTLSGPNTYSGTTTVNGGELDIVTSQTGGGAINVTSGSTFGVVVNNASSVPTSTLTANSVSVLSFSGVSSTTIALLNATNLAPNGIVSVNVAGSFVSSSQYPLIKFSNYTGTGGFALGTLPAGTTANLVTNNGFIKLNVTVATPLVWKGNLSTNWDIATTANWTQAAAATTYSDGQTVQFNDTAATGNVNLSANVTPAGVLVTNNSLSYNFSSATGKGIAGTSGLNKQGPGTATLSGLTNSYTGITAINGGTVVINADNNLGSGGGIVINGGALSATANVTLNSSRSLVLGPASGSGSGALDAAIGQTLTFNGIVANNLSGAGSLNKTGNGTVVLNGANTYGGSTTVSAGTLALTAAQQNGSAITVNNGAGLTVTRSGGTTLPTSALTLGSGGPTALQLGNLSSASAVITATNLTTSGTVTISLPTGVPALGELPLIKYNGSIGGSGFAAFSLPALPAGVTAVLTNDPANKIVGLLVQNVVSLSWTGTNGPTWDIGVTTNWAFLGSSVTFAEGSSIILDDNAFTNQLTLNSTASVFNMLVTNSTLNYTLNGSGGLNGTMTLTKTGSSTFTVANLGNNSFTGGALVQQGILDVRSDNILGTGTITLAGGTLENNSATSVTLANAIVAQTNTTSILQLTGTGSEELHLNGNISGGGNLTAQLAGSLNSLLLGGNNSGFSGTFTVNNNANMRFWFTIPESGSANANWVLDSTGVDNQKFTFGSGTVSFGSLAGAGQLRNDGGNSVVTLRIGDLNTNTTFSGLIVANGGAQFSILKVGTGTWTVTGNESYTGNTVISNGVLALSNNVVTAVDGSIAASSNIVIAAGAMLDVMGRSDQSFTLGGTQTIQGRGSVNGTLNVAGIVAPGDGFNGNVGTLTVSNTVNLANTTWMKLNGVSSDRIISPVAINYGGTLVVTNTGTLQPGTTYTLFSSPTFNGSSFGSVVLANYLAFDTSNLDINGTITFLGYSKPAISSVDFSTLTSGFITLNATNGLASGPVIVLTSTNVALPASAWTPVVTNSFDGSGNYTEAITVNPSSTQQFYMLKVQ